MRNNILVGTYNRIEIVFTDTLKKDKTHNNDKVAKFKVKYKKQEYEGKVYFPEVSEFRDSFEYMFEQLEVPYIQETSSLLTVKYFEGVL